MTSYQSNISDKDWQKVEPHIPEPKSKKGRKRKHTLRLIFNAIFYVLRSGCQWRLNRIWEQINSALRSELRIADGRQPEPSAAIIDSQSVKTTETRGVRGYDAGKKIKGRKRHILVDVMGLLLMVIVHAADI